MFRLLSNLNQLNIDRAVTLARISTGKRINRAADDPAGLVAVNRLSSELAAVDAAINNNTRSQAMLDTASSALAEVSSLLTDIEGLAVASGGNTLSDAEIAANQEQIDSAIASIDRIINTASYGGRSLFNGANEIDVSMTPAVAADLKDVRVYARPPAGTATTLNVNVTAVAKRATTSGTVVANITTTVHGDTTLAIRGKEGTATVVLASGSNMASVLATINASKGETGVSATASGTQLKLTSVEYGADAFVSVSALSGDPAIVASAQIAKRSGTDATITVNGRAASVSGTEFYYNSHNASLSATLVDNTVGARTITITGTGGATFQIGTSLSSKSVIGIGNLNSSDLGQAGLGYLADLVSGGSAALATDPGKAALIARKAAVQVATASARLGGFTKYAIESSTNSLNVLKENLLSSISSIEDADIAVETSRLDRQNILATASLSLLGVMSSQQQSVLSLLKPL